MKNNKEALQNKNLPRSAGGCMGIVVVTFFILLVLGTIAGLWYKFFWLEFVLK